MTNMLSLNRTFIAGAFLAACLPSCGGNVSPPDVTGATAPHPAPACAATGCPSRVLVGNVHSFAIAADDDTLYIADRPNDTIVAIPLDAPTTKRTVAQGIHGASVLVVDSAKRTLYVARNDGSYPAGYVGEVLAVPIDRGSSPRTIASSLPMWITGMARDGDDLLVADFESGDMHRYPIDGHAPSTLFHTQSFNISGIAATQTSILWSNENGYGEVMSAPRTGGASTLLSTNNEHPSGIVVDGAYAYWGNSGSIEAAGGDGAIVMLSLGDNVRTTLTKAIMPGGVASNRRGLYWLEQSIPGFGNDPAIIENVMVLER